MCGTYILTEDEHFGSFLFEVSFYTIIRTLSKNQLAKIYYFHQLIITYFIILVVGQTLLCPHLLHSPLQGVTNNLLQRGHRNKVTSFIKLLQTGQRFAILIPSLNYDLSHKPANQKGCNPRTKPN